MRIGNIEDMEKTKKLPDAEIEAEENKEEVKHKKWKNWWYYHKWYVICGIIVFGIACDLIGSSLGIWTKTPDFQIAYVGKSSLPEETVEALKEAFASLAWDFNDDGEVVVQINQYVNSDSADEMLYGYAAELPLIGDISACESYFFLMDDPAYFQSQYHLLSFPDGSCPDESDDSVEDKVISWAECPLLSQMELGSYSLSLLDQETAGNSQDLLSGFSMGRRCFYNDEKAKNAEQCDALWNLLYNSREQNLSD